MHMTLGSTPHCARNDEQELIFVSVKQGLTTEAQARLQFMITVPPGHWDWKCAPLHPAKRRDFNRYNGKHDGFF